MKAYANRTQWLKMVKDLREKSTESVLVIVEPLPVKNPKLLVKINPKRGKNTIESNIKFK